MVFPSDELPLAASVDPLVPKENAESLDHKENAESLDHKENAVNAANAESLDHKENAASVAPQVAPTSTWPGRCA